TNNPEAYDTYLRGLAFEARSNYSGDALLKAIALYERAVQLDPNFALVWARLSGANALLYFTRGDTTAARRDAAKVALENALKLYDRALDILPNELSLMALKASIYQAQGNLQESAKLLVQVTSQTNSDLAVRIKLAQLRLERNQTEAIRFVQPRQARLRFAPGIDKGSKQGGLALIQRLAGDTASAKAAAEQARNTLEPLSKDQPDNAFVASALAVAYAVLDEKSSALNEAQRAIALVPSSKDRLSGPGYEENLALVETIIGENSRA